MALTNNIIVIGLLGRLMKMGYVHDWLYDITVFLSIIYH